MYGLKSIFDFVWMAFNFTKDEMDTYENQKNELKIAKFKWFVYMMYISLHISCYSWFIMIYHGLNTI